MASYSLVRGWIECSFEEVFAIKEIVSAHWKIADDYQIEADSASLYHQGWFFPVAPFNWVSLVFYGGNVGNLAVPFLKDCMSKIAGSGLDVNGLFHVDDEDGSSTKAWLIREGKLVEENRKL